MNRFKTIARCCALAGGIAAAPLCAQLSDAPTLPVSRSHPVNAHEAERLTRAKALLQQRQFSAAEAEVRDYLKENPNSAYGNTLLGLILYEKNEPADSLAAFTRAASLQAPSASELVVVGLDYVKLRDLKNADHWMTVAVEKDPRSAGAWRYLGGIKYSENYLQEAIHAYGECLKLSAHDVIAEDGIGRSYEGLNRGKEAGGAYRTALQWQSSAGSNYPQPLAHFGGFLVAQGKSDAAIPYLAAARRIAPDDADIRKQLGEAYLANNEAVKARTELERAVALSPETADLHFLLARAYQKLGMAREAEAERQRYTALQTAAARKKQNPGTPKP